MGKIIEYQEHKIFYTVGFYWALGAPFKKLRDAKKFVDDNI